MADLQPIAELTKEVRKLVYDLLGPAAKEAGAIFGDQFKYWRFKRAVVILEKTRNLLREKNIQPVAVNLKVLVPLLESASLEDDDDLSWKWAALLASAASGGAVHPSYPKILAELDSVDVRVLDTLYNWEQESPATKHDLILEANLSENQLPVMFMNLGERLGLINAVRTSFWQPDVHDFRNIRLTPLGTAFVKACRGPVAN